MNGLDGPTAVFGAQNSGAGGSPGESTADLANDRLPNRLSMRVKRESPAASRGPSPEPGGGARRPRRAAAETAVHRMALIAPKFRSRKEIEAAAAARRAFLEAARCVSREAPTDAAVVRTRPSDSTRKVHDVTRPHPSSADTDSKAALQHLVQDRSADGHVSASEPGDAFNAAVEAVAHDTNGISSAATPSASTGAPVSARRDEGQAAAIGAGEDSGEFSGVTEVSGCAGQAVAPVSNHCPAESPTTVSRHCPAQSSTPVSNQCAAQSPTILSSQTGETRSTQSKPLAQSPVVAGNSAAMLDVLASQQSTTARQQSQPACKSTQAPLAKARASARPPTTVSSDLGTPVDATPAALPACVAPGRAGVSVRPPLANLPHAAAWTNHGMPVGPPAMEPSTCTPAFAAALAACQARAMGMQMSPAVQSSPVAPSLPHNNPLLGSVLPDTMESNRTMTANFRSDSGDPNIRSVSAAAVANAHHVIDLSSGSSSTNCDIPTRHAHSDHALHRRVAPYSIPSRQKSPQQLAFGSATTQETDLAQVQHLQAQRLQQIRREIHELQQQSRDQNRGRPQHPGGSQVLSLPGAAQDAEAPNVPSSRVRSGNPGGVLPSVAVLENQLHECEERRAYLRRLLRGGAPGRRDWPSPSEARSLLETAGASAGKFQGDRWFAWGNDPLPSTRSVEWRLARVLDRPALDAAALGDATMWGVLCLTLGAVILGADVDELRTGLSKLGVPVPDSLGTRSSPTHTTG
ncbi:hypothetical protein CSUI_006351 [Cystoisospora suis]|uniref:Uncharacterized protein n=1 Tax=Cystoisospora suis TaxID=483139 RepID=A0A2C6KH48_9APIC|nr:hypothetical protein CSUI_006351 [Cystoisospora suis]